MAKTLTTLIQSLFLTMVLTFGFFYVHAQWSEPTASPPGDNTPAPVNVGSTDQVKSAGLGVDSLAVFGNGILSGLSRYLNFGTDAGDIGYGLRDNAGTMEYKDDGGTWTPFASSTGSGSEPVFYTCTNADSLDSGNTPCYEAAQNGGLGTSDYRIMNCEYSTEYIAGSRMRFSSNKWQWQFYTGGWYDCNDGTAEIANLNASAGGGSGGSGSGGPLLPNTSMPDVVQCGDYYLYKDYGATLADTRYSVPWDANGYVYYNNASGAKGASGGAAGPLCAANISSANTYNFGGGSSGGGGFASPAYDSGWVTYNTAETVVTHGLGSEPDHVEVYLRSKVNSGGIKIGDVFPITTDFWQDVGANANRGASVWYNDTEIGFNVYVSTIVVGKGTSLLGITPSAGNFDIRFKAW